MAVIWKAEILVASLWLYVTLHHEMSRMCQAYFCSSKEFAVGVWKYRVWDLGCNCLRNHLSLVCNREIAHFSVFHGQKHDLFLTALYCFNIEVFNI